MRRKKRYLYGLGWPRQVEVKATTLHGLKHRHEIPQSVRDAIDGDAYIIEILEAVVNSCNPRIDYFAVNKNRIKKAAFRAAEYGIAYNYFTWELLRPMVSQLQKCKLVCDPRNKERHSQKHFEGYIETEALKLSMSTRKTIEFSIEQPDSHMSLGLQAVDIFSWSVYRHVRRKGSQFFNVFKDLVEIGKKWYC